MIDHSDLIEEMGYIEKIARTERVKLACKRRKDQLSTHTNWMKTEDFINTTRPRLKNRRKIRFTTDLELMDIASRNDLDEMKELLKNGADPNQTNHDGLTALHQCCIDGSLDMVMLLINNGANVNIKDRDLWTPLHAAATCGHFKIVSQLIKAGADLTSINGDGDMPHDIAEDDVMQQYLENELAKMGITEIESNNIRNATQISMLADINHVIYSGGDLNQPLDQGGTFLHVAIANGFNDIVKLLLMEGSSISVRDEDGWEPIHVAAYWGNEEALELLSKHKDIDIKATTDNGDTPYDLCEDHETKLNILQIMSDISKKYGSVKMYTSATQQSSIQTDTQLSESDDETINSTDDYEDTVTDTLNFNIYKEQANSHAVQGQNLYEKSFEDIEETNQEIMQDSTSKDETTYTILNLEASEFSERRNSVKEAKHLAPIKRANSMERHQQPPHISNDTKTNLGQHENIQVNILDLISPSRSFPQQSIIAMDDEDEDDDEISMQPQQNTIYAWESNCMINTENTETNVVDGLHNDMINNNSSAIPPEGQKLSEISQTTQQVIKYSKPRAPPPPHNQSQLSHGTSIATNKDIQNDTKIFLRENNTSLMTPQHLQFQEPNNNIMKKNSIPSKMTLIDLKKQRQEARLKNKVNLETDNKIPLTRSTFYDVSDIYDPPPSPTMIRYRFRMTEEEFKVQNIITEKKCSLM